jgi:glycosyltransferase involved in cell wall biosynthesis
MIHDAQVFLTPESYAPAFVAWYRLALPRIGKAAARIVTVSDYSRDRLVEFGVAPREKISVVHNGADHMLAATADLSALDRLGLRPGQFVLAAAGAQKHKNLSVIFDAFRNRSLADLTLVVAGSDGLRAFLASGVTPALGTIFAGRVSDGVLRALYENAACFVCPSTTEGFGLPPIEAMSLGCPTIVAPLGALPEVCGDAALHAEHDRPDAWVAAIARLRGDAALREHMARGGRVWAGRYRWQDSARRLLGIIEAVA